LIRILEDRVVNQIAAGEVVERPASVVKELVENALDAGARLIRVDLKGGGAQSIRVRDDGIGMSRADATMCLERHATSKIRLAEDLVGVMSLGFRGEAIPSIAAVSRFELLTRPEESEVGTRVRVEGGRLEKIEAAGGPKGTRVTVNDLFFNLPARQKFLRTRQTELGHCTETVIRQLLNHPEVDLELNHEGRRLVRAPVHASLNARAAALLGATGRQLMPISLDVEGLSLEGLISPLGVHKGSARGSSYLYVNGRYVQDSLLRRAVSAAYQGLVPRGRYPVVVLRLKLPGEDVDVNVHPAKTEVRFRRARELAKTITEGLRTALGDQGVVAPPSMVGVPGQPRGDGSQGRLGLGGEDRYQMRAVPPPVPEEAHITRRPEPALRRPVESPRTQSKAPVGRLEFLGVLDDRTLLCRLESDLWILDRIQLEAARVRLALDLSGAGDSRPMLSPRVLELNRQGHSRALKVAPVLQGFGFELEDFGQDSIIIKGLPHVLQGVDLEALILEVVAVPGSDAQQERLRCLTLLTQAGARRRAGAISKFELGERVREVFEASEEYLLEIGVRLAADEIEARLRSVRPRED
jgi:DNA mismatch repair protein MutL